MISGSSEGARDARAWRIWRGLTVSAVVAVAVVNVVATARRVQPAARLAPREPVDVVTRYEARFAPVRAVLAERGVRGTIGYIGGEPLRPGAEPDAVLDYLLVQFALAPWVLDHNLQAHAWIVAQPRAGEIPEAVRAEYSVAGRYRGGVTLLMRPAP